jgi:hypothetical protein
MSTRLNDFAAGHKIAIQQRLHDSYTAPSWMQQVSWRILAAFRHEIARARWAEAGTAKTGVTELSH